jgi:hypothetical protein
MARGDEPVPPRASTRSQRDDPVADGWSWYPLKPAHAHSSGHAGTDRTACRPRPLRTSLLEEVLWRVQGEPLARGGILVGLSSTGLALVTEYQDAPTAGSWIRPCGHRSSGPWSGAVVVTRVDRLSETLALVAGSRPTPHARALRCIQALGDPADVACVRGGQYVAGTPSSERATGMEATAASGSRAAALRMNEPALEDQQ